MWSSLLGYWWIWAHPQLLGTAKNKENGLDNLKGLRGNQKLSLGRLTKFNFYTKLLFQDCKRWLFYLMFKNQHRKSKKMKKKSNIVQTKEQDKYSETDLNEMKICGFPDVEFRISILMMLTKVRYPFLCKVRISSK